MNNFDKSNYLKHVLINNKPHRWYKKDIKVYIYQDTVGIYKKNEILFNTFLAFNEWEKALNGKIHFIETYEEKEADIKVQFQRNECNGDIGWCQYSDISENGELKKIDICVGLIYGHLFTQNAMHEIGHALGLINHSTVFTDLMYSSLSCYNLKLSKRDINTIQALYDLPSIIPNINSNTNELVKIRETQSDVNSLADLKNKKDLLKTCCEIGDLNLYKLKLSNINVRNSILL